jgi:hypothetical protein
MIAQDIVFKRENIKFFKNNFNAFTASERRCFMAEISYQRL